MRQLERLLIHYDQCPCEEKKFGHICIDRYAPRRQICIEKTQCKETRGDDRHIQIKEGGLEQVLLSQLEKELTLREHGPRTSGL